MENKSILNPGMRILDVGCGPGNLTAHVAEAVGVNGSVVGIDPSSERIAIALARTRPNLSFCEGRAEEPSRFPPASFDVVFVNSTLHWVQDQQMAVNKFASGLKLGDASAFCVDLGTTLLPMKKSRQRYYRGNLTESTLR